jgi:D-aminopeptidase
MRKRARDLGIVIGRYPTGPRNSLTDVAGVRVGHSTLISGKGKLVRGKGPVRTGVTAILPSPDPYENKLIGGSFVLNGAGELSGVTQLNEWGLLETPILLTNTMSVGRVSDACVKWLSKRHKELGDTHDVVIPVVGECDDSFLNDSVGRHIQDKHVFAAIRRAGEVVEGAVGAGTGMVCCDFKAGIGTSSRVVEVEGETFTLASLVLSNFGVMENLRIDGVPVGDLLRPHFASLGTRTGFYGSIIVVLATDAPMLSQQIVRLCKRAALGIGRAGSYAAHGSGEIVVGFSTANVVPRANKRAWYNMRALYDRSLGPFYECAVEATEEAIINSLCMADEMIGINGNFAPALPLGKVRTIMQRFHPAFRKR